MPNNRNAAYFGDARPFQHCASGQVLWWCRLSCPLSRASPKKLIAGVRRSLACKMDVMLGHKTMSNEIQAKQDGGEESMYIITIQGDKEVRW